MPIKNKEIIVNQYPNEDQRWLCPNCLHYVKDDYCKVGYSATCTKCKKEFEIIKIEYENEPYIKEHIYG